MPKLIMPRKESYPRKSEMANSWIDRIYYSKNILVRLAFLNKIKRFLAIIPKRHFQTVLDIGTGIGVPLLSLIRSIGVDNAVGVDIDRMLLLEVKEMCKREGIYNKCSLLRCDARYLPFNDDYFSLITCLDVLEHINDLERAVKELYRVLNHSGVLIVGYPTDNELVKLAQKILLGVDVKMFHFQDFLTIDGMINSYFSVHEKTRLPFNLPFRLSRYELKECTHRCYPFLLKAGT